MTVSVIMYKRFGVGNKNIALYTSLLYLPWVVKPLWGPLVDLYWTKRNWIVWLQLLLAVIFGAMAFIINTPFWWWGSLAVFTLVAFTSATHDIAADGFYMLGLDQHSQTLFVGIRNTFYRLAMIVGQGFLVILVGIVESHSGPPPVYITLSSAKPGLEADAPKMPDFPVQGSVIEVVPSTLQIAPGTTTPMSVRYNKEPADGSPVVVSISRRPSKWYGNFFPVGSEQLITLTGGDRLEFTKDNWNKARTVIAQADAKAGRESAPAVAVFKATAGNIQLSWTLCFAAMSAIFVILFSYHATMLPRPALDGIAGTDTRPPFSQAAGWLLFAVLVPAAVVVCLFYLIKPGLIYAAHMVSPALDKYPDLFTFVTHAVIVLVVCLAYRSRELRRVSLDAFRGAARHSGIPFDHVFISFFSKPAIGRMVAFLLVYRLGESMIVKMASPFLLDTRENGGLNLSTAQVGGAYGTAGVIALMLGGIIGGICAAKDGFRKWLLPMCLAINLPHLLYVYLAYGKPENFMIILGCVAGEQFCYGFGFTAYTLVMLCIAGEGEYKTSHYAITTGFMALSMMLPGMFSGALQQAVGYPIFFVIVCATMVIGLTMIYLIPVNPEFGKKETY